MWGGKEVCPPPFETPPHLKVSQLSSPPILGEPSWFFPPMGGRIFEPFGGNQKGNRETLLGAQSAPKIGPSPKKSRRPNNRVRTNPSLSPKRDLGPFKTLSSGKKGSKRWTQKLRCAKR